MRAGISLKILTLIVTAVLFYCGYCQGDVGSEKVKDSLNRKYSEVEKLLNSWAGSEEPLLKAAVLLDEIEQEAPNFLPARIERARFVIMSGSQNKLPIKEFNNQALKILLSIEEQDPEYPKAYVMAGHVYTNLDDLKNARKQLDIAERLGTNNPWLHINYAALLIRLQNYDEAQERANKGFILASENEKAMSTALNFLIWLSNKTGKKVDIEALVGSLLFTIKSEERRLRIAETLVDNYLGKRYSLRVAQIIIESQSDRSKNTDYWKYVLAKWYLVSEMIRPGSHCHHYSKATIDKVKPILQSLTNNQDYKFDAFYQLVYLAIEEEKPNLAAEIIQKSAGKLEYEQQLRLDVTLSDCQNNYSRTIDLINEIAKTKPAIFQDKLYANAYEGLGDKSKLKEYYERRLSVEKGNAWLYGEYAYYLMSVGKIDGAIQAFKDALNVMNYRQARMNLYLLLYMKMDENYRKGMLVRAKEYYDQIISIGFREEFERRNNISKWKEAIDYYDANRNKI